MIVFLLGLFIIGCSHSEIKSDQVDLEPPKAEVLDIVLAPGRVKKIQFLVPTHMNGATLYCKDQRIIYKKQEEIALAYIAESYFSKGEGYSCFLKNEKNEEITVANITIGHWSYPEEKLRVNKKRVVLSKKDLKRAIKEKAMIHKIYSDISSDPFFDSSFNRPVNTVITSRFGTKRVFNKIKKSQHLGIDFRAKIGYPVKIANAGKVIYAGNLFFTGNTVIVDHGLGIQTMYGHLSKIKVNPGQLVSNNQIIGNAGRTGRVSGPHLHWGVKVHGLYVDGLSLLEEGF